jgi:transposase
MRKVYPSDITLEQFERIRPTLESARKKTKPRKVDLYEAFCGYLYILKGGCQWRMLPSDFPKWRTVFNYSKIWGESIDDQPSVLEQCLKKISLRIPSQDWPK